MSLKSIFIWKVRRSESGSTDKERSPTIIIQFFIWISESSGRLQIEVQGEAKGLLSLK